MNDHTPSRVNDPDLKPSSWVRLEGIRKQSLETGRNRLLVTGVVFALAFTAISVRLVNITVLAPSEEPRTIGSAKDHPPIVGRADIIDRQGIVLATSLPVVSLYADPRDVLNVEEVADKLSAALPELSRDQVLAKLDSKSTFVWLRRNLTPKQHYEVNRLGLPGLAFQQGERRIYPHGAAASHVLGYTDVDGQGISGLEKQFDRTLGGGGEALRLSIDLRVQDLLRDELTTAMSEFKALGAAGMVLDANTGETLAMVSLPDFDPNIYESSRGESGFNRVTKGVYEMGSTFKLFTTAMALDSGAATLSDSYDASKPIRISRFTISDFHPMNRWMTVQEILVHSSNIGAAKMAVDVGAKTQKLYLGMFGLLTPAVIELPEVGTPLTPSPWREINTMTISYGHGIAVSPLQLAAATAMLVNGGIARPVTLLSPPSSGATDGKKVLSPETSRQMRELMRMVVTDGTGRKAEAPGYMVGGKTGTAIKQGGGGYREKSLVSSFVGAFPMNAPRYVVLAIIDEPKGNKATQYYATGGWVAAPVVSRMVQRMAPLVGIAPTAEKNKTPQSEQPQMAAFRILPAKPQESDFEAQ
ncbi:MAG: penicillin-binding protein [Rhodospirillales bacterium RIFCSPLOWO2_02_FULL_58_16]|nr:MAG: penicillin-binding protein [Rhodospirillales bacterium RIFCSPLOWO2_02_FULL_58_16]